MKSGTIDLSRNHNSTNRLKHMMLLVVGMIRSTKPDMVAFEDVQKQSNVATFKMLSQLQGAIMYYCYEIGVKFTILTPTSWRKTLGFEQGRKVRRAALKKQSVDYVCQRCGMKKLSDDEADAVCIGLAADEVCKQ